MEILEPGAELMEWHEAVPATSTAVHHQQNTSKARGEVPEQATTEVRKYDSAKRKKLFENGCMVVSPDLSLTAPTALVSVC